MEIFWRKEGGGGGGGWLKSHEANDHSRIPASQHDYRRISTHVCVRARVRVCAFRTASTINPLSRCTTGKGLHRVPLSGFLVLI